MKFFGVLLVIFLLAGCVQNNAAVTPEINPNLETPRENIDSITPNEIIVKADSFVISQVGESYFKENFVLAVTKTDEQTSFKNNSPDATYLVFYEYLPLSVLTQSKFLVSVNLGKNLDSPVFSNTILDCVNEPTLCEFTVTKEQALKTAKENGVSGDANQIFLQRFYTFDDPAFFEGWGWVVFESIDDQSIGDCMRSKMIVINSRIGNASNVAEKTACP